MLYKLICSCCKELYYSLGSHVEYIRQEPLCEPCYDKHVDLLFSAHDRKKVPKHTICGMILE